MEHPADRAEQIALGHTPGARTLEQVFEATRETIETTLNGSPEGERVLEYAQGLQERVAERRGVLLPGIRPVAPQGGGMPSENAKAAIRDAVHKAIGGGRVALFSTAGIGKTSILIAVVAETAADWQPLAHVFEPLVPMGPPPRPVDVYIPLHKLADQIAEDLRNPPPGSGRPPVTVGIIRGRNYVDESMEPYCMRLKLVKKLREFHVTAPGQTLCATPMSRCPHIKECLYAAQFKDIRRRMPQVIIRAHEALFTEASFLESEALEGWRKDPAVVVDEDPRNAGHEFNERGWRQDYLERLGDEHASPNLMVDVVAAAKKGQDVAEALTGRGEELREFLQSLRTWAPTTGRPELPDELLQDHIRHAIPKDAPVAALEGLLEAIEQGTPYQGIWWNKASKRLMCSAMRSWVAGRKDILILDSTGIPDIYRRWIPSLEIIEARPPRNLLTIQFYDQSWSASYIKGRDGKKLNKEPKEERINQARLAFKLAESLHGEGKVAFASQLGLETALGLDEDSTVHFGAARGLNRLKDKEAVVSIGRPLPTPFEVEALTRALWPREALELPGEYISRPAGYRGRVEGFGVVDIAHPDPRAHLVLQSIRESEVEQAADRIRSVYHSLYDARPPKLLYLFVPTPMPFGADVLAHSPLDPRLAEAMLQTGLVLPLSPSFLAERFPSLWKTTASAKLWCNAQYRNHPDREPDGTGIFPYKYDIYTGRYLSTRYVDRGESGRAAEAEWVLRYAIADPLTKRKEIPAPIIWRVYANEWSPKPEWLEPLQRSGGRLGLQLVRFHASKLHMRKPVGGVALHAANVDPLPVLQELFVGQEVRLL